MEKSSSRTELGEGVRVCVSERKRYPSDVDVSAEDVVEMPLGGLVCTPVDTSERRGAREEELDADMVFVTLSKVEITSITFAAASFRGKTSSEVDSFASRQAGR